MISGEHKTLHAQSTQLIRECFDETVNMQKVLIFSGRVVRVGTTAQSLGEFGF